MSETHSKSREQAEKAFRATQTQSVTRSHVLDELDAIAQARHEKTQRLREARLAMAPVPAKRGKKS